MTNLDEITALKSYQSIPVEHLASGDAENTQNLEVSDSSLFASTFLRRRTSLLFVTIGMVVVVACMRFSYSLGVKHVGTVDRPLKLGLEMFCSGGPLEIPCEGQIDCPAGEECVVHYTDRDCKCMRNGRCVPCY